MPEPSFLLYGATGYTGQLLARAARRRGLRPLLCGRDAERVGAVASELGLECRVARLDGGLDGVLSEVPVVLHAAGPFRSTFRPMVEACLRTGTHYLDITGEVEVLEEVYRYDAQAREKRVMLMSGVGFDVVPSDCLASYLARQVPGARRLALGVAGLDLASRGSLRTLVGMVGQPVLVRRGGQLVGLPPGSLRRWMDYGTGPSPSVAVSWGDVSSAYRSTGIPDIEVYFEERAPVWVMLQASRWLGGLLGTQWGQRWLEWQLLLLPEGPSEAQRAVRQATLVAEVEDGAGRCVRARLHTPEAYTFTCEAALAVVERVLRGDVATGFRTPSGVWGSDFVLSLPGVRREAF